jgi:hypothetical protein
MVNNLAAPIQSDTQTFSVPELRQRTISRMTGIEAGTWDFTTNPINFVCIDNGAGFIKGHFYTTMNDGTVLDTFRTHNHSSSAEGGSIYDIHFNNTGSFIDWNKSAGVFPSDFGMVTVSGAGTLTTEMASNQMYSKFLTDVAANDYVNGIVGGGRLFFASPMTLQLKYAMSHNTAALLKVGIAVTTVENAAGTGAQLGFEHCSASNVNIGIFTADGTTRQTDFLTNVVQAIPFGLRADYYPSSKVIARNGAGLSVIHTSNLPSISSASNSDNLVRFGVKSTNTTAKTFKLYAARVFGTSYDSSAGVQAWI